MNKKQIHRPDLGVFETAREYHGNGVVGSSTLKAYMSNPLRAWKTFNGEIEFPRSQALVDGSLVHCLILEPHDFDNEFVVIDDFNYSQAKAEAIIEAANGRDIALFPDHLFTKSGNLSTAKAAVEEIERLRASSDTYYVTYAEWAQYSAYGEIGDRDVITSDKLDWAEKIADKALNYQFRVTTMEGVFEFSLQEAMNNDKAIMERSFYAYWNEDGTVTKEPLDERSVKIKARPDIMLDLGNDMFFVVDVKTAPDATVGSFNRGGGLYYHLQEAHYTAVLEANGIKVYKFKFLYVGKEDYSGCQDYEYDIPAKDLGREHFTKAMVMHRLALDGEVREAPFDGKQYDREPIVSLPSYLFYQ